MLEWTFWILVLLGAYPYALYPIFVRLLGRALQRPVHADEEFLPRVTVITAAYNEVACIEASVRNKLTQDYPPELLNVVVVSDESTDGTDEVIARLTAESARVRGYRQVPRQGKTAALNAAVPGADGEILVFADANSIYDRRAVRKLVRNFADPSVGYVSGLMKYGNPDGSLVGDGCTSYMRYENSLRAAETRIGSIVGVDGGVDAVRKILFRPMRVDQLPDFVLPLNVIEQGYRVVFEPDAVLREETLTTSSSEYRMRVRVALRAFWALWDKRGLLDPFRHGIFAWQLLSHKVLRYLAFLPLSLAALINWLLLSEGPIYRLMAAGQLLLVVMVVVACTGRRQVLGFGLPAYCQYFLLLNWASAVAFVRFLLGEKKVLWRPRQG